MLYLDRRRSIWMAEWAETQRWTLDRNYANISFCCVWYPLRALRTFQIQPLHPVWMINLSRELMASWNEDKWVLIYVYICEVGCKKTKNKNNKKEQFVCCIGIGSSHLHHWELKSTSLLASSRTWTQWMQNQIFLITDFCRKQLFHVPRLSW